MRRFDRSRVAVQAEDFDSVFFERELREGQSDVGAIATFTGIVRDSGLSNGVIALTLEHYPGMTEKSMQNIVDEALRRWPLFRVLVVHRVGRLMPSDNIVYVGVSSAHRKAALAACEYVIDQLKTKAVFWKKEETESGSVWLLPTEADSNIADSY